MDMIHGSIWDKLIKYALPVAATGILEQLFNASDVAVVGNFTGNAKTLAVAAVGANSPIVGIPVCTALHPHISHRNARYPALQL